MSTLEEPVGCNTVRLERIYSIRSSTKFYTTVDESKEMVEIQSVSTKHTNKHTLDVLVQKYYFVLYCCTHLSSIVHQYPNPTCQVCVPQGILYLVRYGLSTPAIPHDRVRLIHTPRTSVGIMFGVLITKTTVVDKFSTATYARRKK